MPKYLSDLQDIEFNLFNFLNIEQYKNYGLEKQDIKSLLSEYNKFIATEVFPSREPSDIEGVKLVNGNVVVPECLKKFHHAFHENGFFALGQPEEIGGMPAPEALVIACTSLMTGANNAYSMYPGLTKAAMNVIRMKGDQKLKDTYLPKMMEGCWSGTMCLTEAGAGSDVGALRSTATPNNDGTYSIKGVKIFISGGEADLYENTIHLVLAKTPNAPEGTKGISLFVVPRFLATENAEVGANNNVVCTKVEHKMGIHASATCELNFGMNGECKGWMIGEEFDGMTSMFIMMNEARLLCGIQGEAQANLAYLMSEDYAKERSQFGKTINELPDVKRMLIKMRSASRGMRALCMYTADLFDQSKTDETKEGLIGLLTPITKAYCSEEGTQVSMEAVQTHGGYGYCQEYGVEQFLRDTVIAKIYEGTNGIQAMDFVMRKIVKNEGKDITMLLKKIGGFCASELGDYQAEKNLLLKSLSDLQEVLGDLTKDVVAKKFDKILGNSHDIMMMSSHLIVAWLLGEHAIKAKKDSGLSSEYVTSKQEDFSFYARYYLSKNFGIKSNLQFSGLELSELEI
jgi:hypothetical protein